MLMPLVPQALGLDLSSMKVVSGLMCLVNTETLEDSLSARLGVDFCLSFGQKCF
jgi:hypothetical protein